MKLKNRLSTYAVTIFSVIILTVSAMIYFSFYSTTEKKEMRALKSKSILAAIYYLEQDELPVNEHENIKAQLLKTFSRKNIAIYDIKNKKVYGKMELDEGITSDFLKMIKIQKESTFKTNKYFYHGISYSDNQGNFVVVVREPKIEFNEQMNSLFQILCVVSFLGVASVYFFSQYLGYIAYKPINHFIRQIKNRNGINFNTPIKIGQPYLEIKELLITYNSFINQITQTLSVQKNFIDYVSHELRTPITAIMGTLEVTKQKKRTIDEYQQALQELKQYTSDLQESIDQMMLLSGACKEFELIFIRVDEIIWEIIENQIMYHRANIRIELKVDKDKLFLIMGNKQLLTLAIGNLITNAIKYSDNQQIHIIFKTIKKKLILEIKDFGIGIDPDDLPNIRKKFFRGKNASNYQGKGIGLSIAEIIFNIHKIQLEILPNQPRGTIMRLRFLKQP